MGDTNASSNLNLQTRYRRIIAPIPVPESLPILEKIRQFEPRATDMMPPVVWDRADDFQIYDAYGNCWIDFTSGIYVANAGHAHPDVCAALEKQIRGKLLHAYQFPTEIRARLIEQLIRVSPSNLTKVYLASTGAESIEVALKLARLHGIQMDPRKTVFVSSEGAFHGRTMGAQMLSFEADQKHWIVNLDPDFHQIPFPMDDDGELLFPRHLDQLSHHGVDPQRIAAFVFEGHLAIRGPASIPSRTFKPFGIGPVSMARF